MRFVSKGKMLPVLLAAALLAGCAEVQVATHVIKKSHAPLCKEEGDLKVGNPYIVDGLRYYPIPSSYSYRERGIASWYGEDFHGKASANGECYNMYAFTAAHKTLPLPSIVRVTNLENHRSIIVKVNDRGPFVAGRLIDLSYAAAQSLDVARQGTAPVLVEAIGGPHHHPDGAKGLLAAKAGQAGVLQQQLGPRDKVASTLPTIVPGTLAEEELAPATRALNQGVPATAPQAQLLAQGQPSEPAPARPSSLPTAPERADVPNSSPVPLTATRVYVQVGAFSDKILATDAMRRLKALDGSAALAPVTRADGVTLWRVRSGPYQTSAEAESALAKIRDRAADGISNGSSGFGAAQIKVEQK